MKESELYLFVSFILFFLVLGLVGTIENGGEFGLWSIMRLVITTAGAGYFSHKAVSTYEKEENKKATHRKADRP